MKTRDTISYKGCTISVHHDKHAENPFESWDCEPPLIVFYDGIKRYQNAPDMSDLIRLIPESAWKRGERMKLIRELNCTVREFAEYKRDYNCNDSEAFSAILCEDKPEPRRSWREATDYMEAMEWLCNVAGIPCHGEQSNGYCQGDSSLLLAIATPAWAQLVGAPEDSLVSQCKSACNLYSAWAWGDAYGYTCEAEDGQEIDDASVWCFYGRDHKESGLLESAQNQIDYFLSQRQKEAEALEAALCGME